MVEMIANRYRLLGELGRGNMGVVYRAADTLEGDRPVALKVIEVPGAITRELELLFKEEFRAMAKLRHPNTIAVHGYGQLDERRQYLTMEIVPGRELAEVIGGAPMPVEQVYPLLIQLLQALGFIHSRLYVHHDIKAQNIRVTPEGTLKLMDFGLMCQLGRPAFGGKVTGTPGYLPPEIVRGGVINASTDLYSVGCLAFEMLTGTLPFGGKVGEVIRAHAQTPPPRLREKRPDAPEALERLVARLLEKDQDRRYQTATDVIADLAAIAGLQVAKANMAQRASYLTTGTLVAREAELAELEAGLTEAAAGRGNAMLVGAPAGVGKSRLVQELVLHAKLDFGVVAHGHCLEAGQDPYEPMRQAIRTLAPLTTEEERERFAGLLYVLAPEVFPEPEGFAGKYASKEQEKIAILDAVTKFLEAVSARTPILLLIDDMHWADPQTLELFNHVVRQAAGLRLLCVGTFRSDETPPGSPVWYTVEEGAARLLSLQPFNRAQVRRVVEAMLHEVRLFEDGLDFLFGSTAGNAFFLTELLRHLMEENLLVHRDGAWELQVGLEHYQAPRSVEETVGRRLAQLTPGARALAGVASVIGRYQDRDILLHVSGLDPETLFVRLDELIERQFIVREEGHYAFPHDRVRETLYGGLDDADRQRIHQRCGEHLERVYGQDTTTHLQDLAHHFLHGQDALKAFHYLDKAGDAALEVGASGLAVERYLQAEPFLAQLDLPDQFERQIENWWDIAGHGFNIVPGASAAATEKLTAALSGPGGEGVEDHAVELIKAYALQSAAYGFCGQPTRGLEAVEKAIALLGPGTSPLHGALIMTKVANLFPEGRFDEVKALSAQARPFLVDVDLTGQGPLVYNTRVGAISYPNSAALAGEKPDPARRDLAIWAANEGQSYGLLNIIKAFFGIWGAWTGREADAVAYIEDSLAHCRKLGAPPYPWPLYLRPYMLWQRGEFEDARQLVDAALKYPHLDHIDLAKQLIVVLGGQASLALGDMDAAEAAFTSAEARGREAPMAVVLMRALLGKGELALTRQDLPAARRAFEEVRAMAHDGPFRNPLHEALAERLLGQAALQEKLYTRAREHLERALAIVVRPEQDNAIEQAHVHRLLGEVSLGQGDRPAAAAAWRKAGDLYHRLRNRHWLHALNRHLEALQQTPTAPPAAGHEVSPASAGVTPEQRFEHLRGMLRM